MIQSSCLWNLFMTKIAVVTGLRLTDTLLMPSMKRIPGLAHRRERLRNMFLCEALISKPTTQTHTHTHTHTRFLSCLITSLVSAQTFVCVCVCVCLWTMVWRKGITLTGRGLWEAAKETAAFPSPHSTVFDSPVKTPQAPLSIHLPPPLWKRSLSVAVYSKMIYFQQSNLLVFSLCSVAH